MDLVEAAQHASDDGSFELGGERFAVTDLFPGGRDGAFSLIKPRAAIDAYRLLLGGFDRPRMIELGIAYGGSVGFLALAADPTKFVAIEVNETRVEIVDDFIERRGLADIVVPVYGVDQSDRSALHEIVQLEFGAQWSPAARYCRG